MATVTYTHILSPASQVQTLPLRLMSGPSHRTTKSERKAAAESSVYYPSCTVTAAKQDLPKKKPSRSSHPASRSTPESPKGDVPGSSRVAYAKGHFARLLDSSATLILKRRLKRNSESRQRSIVDTGSKRSDRSSRMSKQLASSCQWSADGITPKPSTC